MAGETDLPVLELTSQATWEAWLTENHASSPGVWLKLTRKSSSKIGIAYPEAVEGALCFGWIDGQAKGLDSDHWVQRFTPRRSRSKWSKINRIKALGLIDAGRMRSAGLAQVELAKADGRWDAAYDGQRTMTVPDDLKHALDENEKARAFFAILDRGNRYAILWRLHDAKKPETRARRLEKFIVMLSEGQKLHR